MRVDSIASAMSLYRNNSVASVQNKGVTPVFNGPVMADTVSFSGKTMELLTASDGEAAAKKLAASTSGYRAYYSHPTKPNIFNDAFVNTTTDAVIRYAKEQNSQRIMVAGDTRKATQHYSPKIKKMFQDAGLFVMIPQLEEDKGKGGKISPVATPVLALATRNFNMPISVLMTASHNPWEYGGYNFLTNEGAVATDKVTGPLADSIREISRTGETTPKAAKAGGERTFDPYKMYADHVKDRKLIDFDIIKNSGLQIFYEDFGGTGKYYFPKLMKENGVHLKKVLHSRTDGPDPSDKNLEAGLGKEVVKSKAPLKVGLANDGDSDRFGIIDEKGKFVNENDVILLVAYNQIKYGDNGKGIKDGHIIRNHATSARIDALANYFNETQGANIRVDQTPVGFKYIGDTMIPIEEHGGKVIVAGEESGGLTIGNHIPEKDGFIAVAKIAELVAREGKSVSAILQDIKDNMIGDYTSKRVNVEFAEDAAKDATVGSFQGYLNGTKTELAGFQVDTARTQKVDKELREYKKNGDGIKIYLEDGSSVLVRKSGTEPVMRLYIDAKDATIAKTLEETLVGAAEENGGRVKE